MQARHSSQRGFAVVGFAVVLAIVAFTIVLGYSVSSAKTASNNLYRNQQAYLKDVRVKLAAAYAANAATIDADASWSAYSTATPAGEKALLDLAGVTERWGLRVQMTPPIAKENIKYRVIAAWLPYVTDAPETPVLNADGTFVPCPAATTDCTRSLQYAVISDGFSIQRQNAKKSADLLSRIALQAQSFFKTKYLQDPERNVSVNYFRPPIGCTAVAEQFPCIDAPAPIWGVSPAIKQSNNSQSLAELLGLPSAPVLNSWGLPIEACNGTSCNDPKVSMSSPPYTMFFQSPSPWGTTTRVYAVQQL
jgi:hypothetical protein